MLTNIRQACPQSQIRLMPLHATALWKLLCFILRRCLQQILGIWYGARFGGFRDLGVWAFRAFKAVAVYLLSAVCGLKPWKYFLGFQKTRFRVWGIGFRALGSGFWVQGYYPQ